MAHFVVAAARQFGSDWGYTGHVSDIADLALMTRSGPPPVREKRAFRLIQLTTEDCLVEFRPISLSNQIFRQIVFAGRKREKGQRRRD